MLDTVDELLRKIRYGGDFVLFEKQAVPWTSFSDLEANLYRRFIPPETEDPQLSLRKIKLLTEDDLGVERASVAGALLCSHHPEIWLPSAYIEAVRYRSVQRDSYHQVAAARITGSLDEQIRQAVSFVLRNRKELPELSPRAVFEAVANAVVHRDYSVYAPPIRLFHFADRLEIYSPGAPPDSLTVNDLRFQRAPRNEIIMFLLSRLGVEHPPGAGRRFVEGFGTGVPIILRESRKISGRDPEYRLIDDAELLLTIWSAELPNRIDLTPEIKSLEA
ncbi:MAG TPA: ATP-binding protein [Thermoanaerobaculia bacterium]|nr:ATP-binding protein [Thermoanaerobaculia bacterium]